MGVAGGAGGGEIEAMSERTRRLGAVAALLCIALLCGAAQEAPAGGGGGGGGGGATRATTRGASTQVTVANPHRWAEAMAKFDAADRENMPAPGGIVFTGSSTVRGWKLAEAFPGLPVVNRGFGGSHSSDCVFWFDRVVLKYRPKVVVLLVGSNDVDSGRPLEVVLGNHRRFAELLRATLPEARLVVVALKPSPSRPDKVAVTLEGNAELAKMARQMGFDFVDPTPGLLDASGMPDAGLYVGDRLHFNAQGFAVLNDALAPVLRRVWGEAGGGR